MTENEAATHIVDVAFKIHSTYGPGLLESLYEPIMTYELKKRGVIVEYQQPIPVVHDKRPGGNRLSGRFDRGKQSCG